uniref:Uncharacterized protein n=1 Tax=Nicotiana tabacum TaxID=4097 RepID=A0A1S4CGI4_TOBAC|nr:PREDICTED: uncharacterized protein LOC107818746 [Nicotiana tabacum]
MATPSAYLAEAYVMGKQYKEKMKTELETNDTKKQHNDPKTSPSSSSSSSSSGGCFSMKIFKKAHPKTAPPPSDSAVTRRGVGYES